MADYFPIGEKLKNGVFALQACGHRFIKLYGAFNLRQMIGRCYLRGNDLRYDENDSNWQDPEQSCRYVT